VLAELGSEDSEVRELAVAYKECRRLWYRDLLSQLDVDDPDTLATQLALLVDGAYAAVLVHQNPAHDAPDDPSVPRVGWRPITVLTAAQSFDRSNANQGTRLSDVIRGNLFPTRCYLLMSN
jgi:hypothetical protein